MDAKTIFLALVGGFIPSIIWLWFWLKEDKEKPEPKGLIFITFILGMLMVIFVIPIEKIIHNNLKDIPYLLFIALASTEEIMKYLAVSVLAMKSKYINEPINYPIYFLTAALGFAALENFLFLLGPLSQGETLVGLMTGNLRFLGATLLHAAASSIIGIAMALAFFKSKIIKKIYLFVGIISAIALHSIFNFFIMNTGDNSFLNVFAFLWVVVVIILLIFEKIRKMSSLK